MGRLLLVRHGESLWNEAAIVQGQAGPGLSALGHRQASHVGDWLAVEAPSAALASSDLVRCRETCAPYAAAVGREPSLDEALRERHFGSWQGVSRAEIMARDPELWQFFKARKDVIADAGGESTPTLVDRVVPALRRWAAAALETVVFTHGGPVWHGVHALLGVDEGTLGPVANAGVTVLDLDNEAAGGGATLVAWNMVGHLPPDVRTSWPTAAIAGDGIT
jgi:broad specificity phosphatase PhoE